MKKILIAYFLMIISNPIMAQVNDLQNSVKDISAELASINQQIIDTYQAQESETQPLSNNVKIQQTNNKTIQISIPMADFQNNVAVLNHYKADVKNKNPLPKNISKNQTQDVYEIIINKMRALKKKYESNPYIRIAGFDINIGIVPSVTISIEFKK
jgi:hypothetical protein